MAEEGEDTEEEMDVDGEEKEFSLMRDEVIDNVDEELMMVYLGLAVELLDSDEEMGKEQEERKPKAPNKDRDFKAANEQVLKDYFRGPDSIYNERDFERRFRVPRTVFNVVHGRLIGIDPFVHKRDCFGNLGIYPLVKLVACFRYLAYGDSYDREDENLRLAESTLNAIVRSFCKVMIEQFGGQYLNRCPNENERKNISDVMATRGFPGCIGSWDCKHFNWKNCPSRLAGQHQGHAEGGKKTLILEAVADHRRYIWQANFGDAGSLNDLNVLDKSSIVGSLLTGDLSIKTEPYEINGTSRDWMYFLVDGIYPEWSIFVTTYTDPIDPKKKAFAKRQESTRKDIKCAFGVLVQRFHVLQRPLRGWFQEDLADILHTCVILHNMVVEARFGSVDFDSDSNEGTNSTQVGARFALFGHSQITMADIGAEGIDLFTARMSAFDIAVQTCMEHYNLKDDLVEHISSNM
jgi:Plant transposon protein